MFLVNARPFFKFGGSFSPPRPHMMGPHYFIKLLVPAALAITDYICFFRDCVVCFVSKQRTCVLFCSTDKLLVFCFAEIIRQNSLSVSYTEDYCQDMEIDDFF